MIKQVVSVKKSPRPKKSDEGFYLKPRWPPAAILQHLDFVKNSLALEPFNRFAPNFDCQFRQLCKPVSTCRQQVNPKNQDGHQQPSSFREKFISSRAVQSICTKFSLSTLTDNVNLSVHVGSRLTTKF